MPTACRCRVWSSASCASTDRLLCPPIAHHAADRRESLLAWIARRGAATHTFSLLCGYAIGNFYKQAAGLDEVASQHTHVIGPQSNVVAIEEYASKKSNGNTAK
jgi:hypothetical protein